MIREDYPRPAATYDFTPFWEFCKQHDLRLQKCSDCGEFRYHPRPNCPNCRSAEFEWSPVSGRGTVYTYTICHGAVMPVFQDKAPYNAVVVQLEEGPFMLSNLLDIANEDIRIDMPVQIAWADIDDELTLPQFRPA